VNDRRQAGWFAASEAERVVEKKAESQTSLFLMFRGKTRFLPVSESGTKSDSGNRLPPSLRELRRAGWVHFSFV
jgi:hypothetical protein